MGRLVQEFIMPVSLEGIWQFTYSEVSISQWSILQILPITLESLILHIVFFEDSWVDICGVRYADLLLQQKVGFPVVHVESDFHAPLRYGDVITATIWIENVGETSCTWCYEFRNQQEELLWTSTHVTVCVDMDSMQRMSIPDHLRDGLESCGRDEGNE